MHQPVGFSWIDRPRLAALAWPDREDLLWLRRHGIDMLLSLTEHAPYRRDVDDAGLLLYHLPVPDMTPPSQSTLDEAIKAIGKAHEQGLGVAVHCAAGLGRTGTVLACWFVSQGQEAAEAIRTIRQLRPGSIETEAQEQAVHQFFSELNRTE